MLPGVRKVFRDVSSFAGHVLPLHLGLGLLQSKPVSPFYVFRACTWQTELGLLMSAPGFVLHPTPNRFQVACPCKCTSSTATNAPPHPVAFPRHTQDSWLSCHLKCHPLKSRAGPPIRPDESAASGRKLARNQFAFIFTCLLPSAVADVPWREKEREGGRDIPVHHSPLWPVLSFSLQGQWWTPPPHQSTAPDKCPCLLY